MNFAKINDIIFNRSSSVTSVMAISFVALLAYGPFVADLGFYYDDWPSLWAARSDNPLINLMGVSSDRPASGVLMYLVSSVMPESPVAWHILVVLLMASLGGLVYLIMLLIWPERKQDALIIAVLFTAYPGVKVHSSAWIFTHALFIPAVLYFFTLYLTLAAVRYKKYLVSFSVCGV